MSQTLSFRAAPETDRKKRKQFSIDLSSQKKKKSRIKSKNLQVATKHRKSSQNPLSASADSHSVVQQAIFACSSQFGKVSAIEVQRLILTLCSPVEQSKTISVSPDPLSTTRCHGCAATWYIESTALLLSSLKPTGEPPRSTKSGTSSICVAICGAVPKSQSVWPRPAELFFEQREERGRGRRSPLFARLRAALAPPPWPWLSSVPWERCGALLLPGPRRSIAVHAAKQHAVVTLFAAIRLPWRDGHP